MNNIYYIGGSPCCGKSSIAEKIVEKYNFQYYKVDDFLDKYISKGSDDGDEWLKYVFSMSLDDLWLRAPQILNGEELRTYEKLFPYFINDLKQLSKNTPVIAEGAAFLPYLIKRMGVDRFHYICIVPTKKFQISNYSKRLWVDDYLFQCSDKKKAFDNWMNRDALFAISVLEQAKKAGYNTLTVDGIMNIDENLLFVEKCFALA